MITMATDSFDSELMNIFKFASMRECLGRGKLRFSNNSRTDSANFRDLITGSNQLNSYTALYFYLINLWICDIHTVP